MNSVVEQTGQAWWLKKPGLRKPDTGTYRISMHWMGPYYVNTDQTTNLGAISNMYIKAQSCGVSNPYSQAPETYEHLWGCRRVRNLPARHNQNPAERWTYTEQLNFEWTNPFHFDEKTMVYTYKI